jgi:hypothetical protein
VPEVGAGGRSSPVRLVAVLDLDGEFAALHTLVDSVSTLLNARKFMREHGDYAVDTLTHMCAQYALHTYTAIIAHFYIQG